MVSEQGSENGFSEPLVEEPGEMMLLMDGEDLARAPDAFAGYVRTRPYEATLLVAAAGMALGLLIGLRA